MARHTWLDNVLTAAFYVFISCSIVGQCAHAYKRVCYFTNWSQYRLGAARYTVANVDPFLCTHLIYAFVGFDGQGNLKPSLGNPELTTFAQFNGLKDRNPNLKTLIAIGGWNFGSKKFSAMADDPVQRRTFVNSAITFINQHGFDGLDLDWEYPGLRGGSAKDKDNLVILCKELRQAFDSVSSGNNRLLLSAAVAASRHYMDIGYDVQALNRYLDIWNLMTYDYHGAWEGRTGHNSPLHTGPRDTDIEGTLNVEWTATEYVRRGASKDKIMVGLPMYGHSYTLTTVRRDQPGSAASLGPAGPYTRQGGVWSYYEVCRKVAEDTGIVTRDITQGVPYYVNGNLWVSFDDVESVKQKIQWLKKNGFGGYMAWSLDMDVFNTDLCPSVSSPYPLLSTANAVLLSTSNGDSSQGTGAQGSQTGSGSGSQAGSGSGSQAGSGSQVGPQPGSGPSSVTGSQTGVGSNGFSCEGRPYRSYADPSSQCRFIVCWANTAYMKACPQGLIFSQELGVCDWPVGAVTC